MKSAGVSSIIALLLLGGCVGIDDSSPTRSDGAPELAQRTQAIAGGRTQGDYPATALLSIQVGQGRSTCSAELIGCSTLLTAAHCVCLNSDDCDRTIPPEDITVFFQHAGIFEVAEVVVSPKYTSPDADVAVLRLREPVSGIRPTPLFRRGWEPGNPGKVVGFGVTASEEADSGIKREGNIVATTSCPDKIGNSSTGLTDSDHICWSYPGNPANVCPGDSGGPFLAQTATGYAVAGIASGAYRDPKLGCSKDYVSYQTRVGAFADHIEDLAGGDVGGESCGSVPTVGSSRVSSTTTSGTLTASEAPAVYALEVPEGADELRVNLNGTSVTKMGEGRYRRNSTFVSVLPPEGVELDGPGCVNLENGSLSTCEIVSPPAGVWRITVEQTSGGGTYQLTTALFGVKVADDLYQAAMNTPLDVDGAGGVLRNDQIDRGEVQLELTESVENGTLEFDPEDGSFIYTPNPGFRGRDRFRYRASALDTSGAATVTITVGSELVRNELDILASGEGLLGER